MALPRVSSWLALAALALLTFPVTTIAALAAVTGHWPHAAPPAAPPDPTPIAVRLIAIDPLPAAPSMREARRLEREAERMADEAAAMADRVADELDR